MFLEFWSGLYRTINTLITTLLGHWRFTPQKLRQLWQWTSWGWAVPSSALLKLATNQLGLLSQSSWKFDWDAAFNLLAFGEGGSVTKYKIRLGSDRWGLAEPGNMYPTSREPMSKLIIYTLLSYFNSLYHSIINYHFPPCSFIFENSEEDFSSFLLQDPLSKLTLADAEGPTVSGQPIPQESTALLGPAD